jgi:sulfur carrier protein ThiS
MKVKVKTAGLLSRYLPAGSAGTVAEIEVAKGATPIDVVAQLGMPTEASYLITLNGMSLPKAERATRVLAANDTLAIMPPLRGG